MPSTSRRAGALIASRARRVAIAGVVDDAWSWLVEQADTLTRTVNTESILAAPAEYAAKVEGFVAALLDSRANLERSQNLLKQVSDPAESQVWSQLAERYNTLALGFLSDAEADDPSTLPRPIEVGIAPILVVSVAAAAAVVSVSVGVAAIAWAVVGYDYAQNLREQTALQLRDLEARVEAAKGGYQLQDSTIKPDGEDWPWWAIAVPLGLAAGVGGLLLWRAK